MTRDAEKYKKEDEMWKEKVESKNGLEQFAYQMKGQVEDEKIKEKLDASDVETVKKACEDCLSWLDSNQMAEKEDFEHKREELQGICNPIFSKMYGGGAGGMPGGTPRGMPGGMPGGGAPPGGGAGGPNIEEV